MADRMVSLVFIKWREEQILLGQNIDPKKPVGLWGLIGGKSEGNETPEETAIREAEEETGQDIEVGKIHVEIPKNGPEGEYIHDFMTARILSQKELKSKDPDIKTAKWINFRDIMAGREKMFPSHIQGLKLVLKKMTEQKISAEKFTKHDISILSEGPPNLLKILQGLENAFDDRGKYIIPYLRRR